MMGSETHVGARSGVLADRARVHMLELGAIVRRSPERSAGCRTRVQDAGDRPWTTS